MTLEPAPTRAGSTNRLDAAPGPASTRPADDEARVRRTARQQWVHLRHLERQLHDGAALRISALTLQLGMLRHRIRIIDLTVIRGYGFYNESLSYHHSYKPSVDRMIRRMQLFTQHTGGYPSWWGVNYS